MSNTRPLLDRLLAKVEVMESGCWEWRGSISYGNGSRYGNIGYQGKVIKTHRASYMLFKGEIPDGMQIDHLCRNMICVNPDHLEAVTPRENVHRNYSPMMVVHRSGKCAKGHEVNEENMYFRPDRPGAWLCRICKREWWRNKQQQRRLQIARTTS